MPIFWVSPTLSLSGIGSCSVRHERCNAETLTCRLGQKSVRGRISAGLDFIPIDHLRFSPFVSIRPKDRRLRWEDREAASADFADRFARNAADLTVDFVLVHVGIVLAKEQRTQ